jgi:hypothetical protein
MTLDERVLLGVVLAAGVVVPGIADFALSNAGFDTAGTVAWAVGYLSMALVVWYRWLRPLDFSGPAG